MKTKANAQWLAQHLKASGWQCIVLHMEWFVNQPSAQGDYKTRAPARCRPVGRGQLNPMQSA
jgi:hypothetical protein